MPGREAAGGPDAAALAGLLADPVRLRVLAAVVLGAGDLRGVRAATGLPARSVATAVRRLRSAGLVEDIGDDGLTVRPHVFAEAAEAGRALRRADGRQPVDHGTGDPAAEAVLRAFVHDGRLAAIPAQRAKRLVVLDHVARVFEPGVRYPEAEVNAMLRAFHPDTAALRRHLVDERFLSRAAGRYWRTGGSVEL